MDCQVAVLSAGILTEAVERFPDIGVMPPVIRKKDAVLRIHQYDLYCCGTDIDPECIFHLTHDPVKTFPLFAP
jgi:hypothetical protein